MSIGIISRCIRENKPRGFFKKVKIYKLDDDVFAAELPFGIKDKKIKKAIKNAKKALGADKILYTKDLYKWSEDKSEELFFKIAPKAAEAAAVRFGLGEPYSLAIRQTTVDDGALHTIKRLIYKANSIMLLTDKSRRCQRICDGIMEEFGAAVQIFPYNYTHAEGITIDLDKDNICVFGKSVLYDFEVDENDYGYSIDKNLLFAARNRNFDEIVIKSCFCGKNKLTLGGF